LSLGNRPWTKWQKRPSSNAHPKSWPKNDRLNQAIQHLNVELDEGIEFATQSRSGGSEVAEKALAEKKAKVRDELYPKLVEFAKLGKAVLDEKIGLLNKAHKSAIENDISELEEIARTADAKDVTPTNEPVDPFVAEMEATENV